MAGVIETFKKVVNQTTTEIIDNELPTRIAKVVNTFVTSVFGAVDQVLGSIQDMTKEQVQTASKSKTGRRRTP
jgi:hypothetical protein